MASTFSVVPVISKTKLSSVGSTTLARKDVRHAQGFNAIVFFCQRHGAGLVHAQGEGLLQSGLSLRALARRRRAGDGSDR